MSRNQQNIRLLGFLPPVKCALRVLDSLVPLGLAKSDTRRNHLRSAKFRCQGKRFVNILLRTDNIVLRKTIQRTLRQKSRILRLLLEDLIKKLFSAGSQAQVRIFRRTVPAGPDSNPGLRGI